MRNSTGPQWLGRLKNFFGLFNLTEFEARLLDFLCDSVNVEVRDIVLAQMECFNFVNRVLDAEESQLAYGFTDFYYKRRNTVLPLPKLLPGLEVTEEHVLLECVATDQDGVKINCSFIVVRGALFEIQYRSPQRRWQPTGIYSLSRN